MDSDTAKAKRVDRDLSPSGNEGVGVQLTYIHAGIFVRQASETGEDESDEVEEVPKPKKKPAQKKKKAADSEDEYLQI